MGSKSIGEFFDKHGEKLCIAVMVITATTVGLYYGLQKHCQIVVIQSHNTKELWMNEVVENFNAGGFTIEDDNGDICVQAEVYHTGSSRKDTVGESDLKPHIWSPPNYEWVKREMETNSYIQSVEDCTQTTNIPVGIAMWRPLAELLGWPEADITWGDIADLAVNEEGWDSFDPQGSYGQFLYAHGHPDVSNSGILSWVAALYGWGNVTTTTQLNDTTILDVFIQQKTKDLAYSVAHMGKVDTDLLNLMVKNGISYIHAVANYESNVIRYNKEQLKGKEHDLVMIYPKDGTFWQTEPLCIFKGSQYEVDLNEIAAAQKFTDFSKSKEQQLLLVKHGIRPYWLDLDEAKQKSKEDPFTIANGVDPSISINSVPRIVDPDPQVLQKVRDMWRNQKKPVFWTLLLDVSTSIVESNGLDLLRRSANSFVNILQPNDVIQVYSFSTDINNVFQPPQRVETAKGDVQRAINGMNTKGATNLYNAVNILLEELSAYETASDFGYEKYNFGVVIMAEGTDIVAKHISEDDLYKKLSKFESSKSPHIYTVKFHSDESPALEKIAFHSNGKHFDGSEDAEQPLEKQLFEAYLEL